MIHRVDRVWTNFSTVWILVFSGSDLDLSVLDLDCLFDHTKMHVFVPRFQLFTLVNNNFAGLI
jgi:hypothetical protein